MVEFHNIGQFTKRHFAQDRLRIIEVGALRVPNGRNDLSASKFHIMAVRDCVLTSNMKLVPESSFYKLLRQVKNRSIMKRFFLG